MTPSTIDEVTHLAVTANLSPAVLLTDADLNITGTVGDAFLQHGYLPDHWVGRSVSEILPAEAWLQLKPRYLAALSGEQQSFDWWSVDRKRAYWVQIAPCWENDVVTSLVVVMYDVTEPLRTTEELQRSEARLRETERIICVGSWELCLADQFLTYSSGFARLTGLPPGPGCDFQTCMEVIHVADRETVREAIGRCLRMGSATCECRIVRADGVRTMAIRGETVLGQDGQPAYIRGATLDVTAQRESERMRVAANSLFEQGFEAAPIAMALSDPATGRYMRVNDAMCRLMGRSRDELLGLGVCDITHPDERGDYALARRAFLAGDAREHRAEKRYCRPDGSVVWADVHVAPVRAADADR